MAFWVIGGRSQPRADEAWDDHTGQVANRSSHRQTRHHHHHHHHQQQQRHEHQNLLHLHSRQSPHQQGASSPDRDIFPNTDSIRVKDLAYLVIREHHPEGGHSTLDDYHFRHNDKEDCHGYEDDDKSSGSDSSGPTYPRPMELTASGLPISAATVATLASLEKHETTTSSLLTDQEAALLVRKHVSSFKRRKADSKHARILRTLINPKYTSASSRSHSSHHSRNVISSSSSSSSSAYQLDDSALHSLFSAANEIFFANKLSRRVTWDWSDPDSTQYQTAIVGTTALRRCAALGGWETLIVLSSPVLRDHRYNRRLAIATFLHEMIHSFLFVVCGLKASRDKGHTKGFRQIAAIIDDWVGKDCLQLGELEADLEYFRGDEDGHGDRFNMNQDVSMVMDSENQYASWTDYDGYVLEEHQQQQQHQHQHCPSDMYRHFTRTW